MADPARCRLISFEEFIEFVQKRVRSLAVYPVCLAVASTATATLIRVARLS